MIGLHVSILNVRALRAFIQTPKSVLYDEQAIKSVPYMPMTTLS